MRQIALAVMLAVPSAACERAAAERRAAPVARVNGAEIALRQSGGASDAALAEALEKVIERELLAQQALAARLDRDPQVMEALENARRQVLAEAHLARAASAAGGSTHDEVRAFYRENPALFAERRIYRLRSISLPAGAGMLEGLLAGTAQPAEQLPLAWLPQLARMKAGEIATFAAPPGACVIQLVHAKAAPLSEQQAAPLIERFLAGRRRLETAAAEIRRLREVATIEYLGDFKRGN